MDENNLISELKTTSSEEEEKLEKIANAMEEKARTEPREVVSMLHGSGEENFKKAAFVVLELGDLAFAPLLDSLNEDPPEDYVWDMETLVDIQISHRHKLGKILNAMLLDTREVRMPCFLIHEKFQCQSIPWKRNNQYPEGCATKPTSCCENSSPLKRLRMNCF